MFFHLQSIPTSLPSLWRSGLGTVNSYALIGGTLGRARGASGFLIHVLFANSFQLLASLCYLYYNRLLTTQLATAEWLRFLQEKKALRVSSPLGMQRSSYMLSLPWSYAGPLMLSFVLLHWLISQSVFVVQTTAYSGGPDGRRMRASDASRVGFSPIGIMLTTSFGILLLAALVGNGFRRYENVPRGMVRIATSSSGISAACRPDGEDSDARFFPVSFGVVFDGEDGRVTFSSDVNLERPVDGCEYWLPFPDDKPHFGLVDRGVAWCFNHLWATVSWLARRFSR